MLYVIIMMMLLLYSCYTEMSCPSGVMRCNVKELVQLVDWCQSWYAESNNCNKDRPLMGNMYMCYNGECQWGKHWWMLLFRLFRRENFGEWPTMDIEYSWQCTAISAKFSNGFSHQRFLLYSIYIHTHIYIPCIYCMYFSMWLYVYITVYGWQLH